MLGSMLMRDSLSQISNGRNFLTAKEAAAFCCINIHTLYRLVRGKKKTAPPHVKFGAAIRFPKAKFIAWAENSTEE